MLTALAAWELQLERVGLHGLVECLGSAGLTEPDQWADLVEDGPAMAALGIDPAQKVLLAELAIGLGALTTKERNRLQQEDSTLQGQVAQFVADWGGEDVMVGDMVQRKGTDPSEEGPGLVVAVREDGTVQVRPSRGSDDVRQIPATECEVVYRHCFLSHAQAEAQNQVGLLAELPEERGVRVWYDMSAERLEVRDMVRGIATAHHFVVFLTKGPGPGSQNPLGLGLGLG